VGEKFGTQKIPRKLSFFEDGLGFQAGQPVLLGGF